MQIWAESGKSALPICNYSQILYQFLTFTQNLKRSRFIGYIEIVNNIYFFATNIGADNNATGSNAAEITMSILSDMNIWTQ